LKGEFSRFFEQFIRKGLEEILEENYGELVIIDFKKAGFPFQK